MREPTKPEALTTVGFSGDLGSGDIAPGGVEGEDRRTRVGAFLRRTSFDELPQFLNVFWGDMSVVGPRPERPEFVAQFQGPDSSLRKTAEDEVRHHWLGADQRAARKTSVSDRAEWDNYYIENWSLWLDLKILLTTVPAVLSSFKDVE